MDLSISRPLTTAIQHDSLLATVIVIRFAVSLPDLNLVIYRSSKLRVAALKRCIRTRLTEEFREKDLKLICAGRVLVDTMAIGIALRLNASSTANLEDGLRSRLREIKGKGRETINYVNDQIQKPVDGIFIIGDKEYTDFHNLQQQSPIYVHCAVTGTILSPQALAAELSLSSTGISDSKESGIGNPSSSVTSTSRSQPLLGFDRLLQRNDNDSNDDDSTNSTYAPASFGNAVNVAAGSNNGLTYSDIANLRTQFHALVAARHTPETMPDAQTMLQLEDRWLEDGDSHSLGRLSGHMAGPTATPTERPLDEEDTASAALDDILLGVVTGFFWPIGALAWGLRETGVWSWRRQISVIAGILVNLSFGFVRFLA